MKCHCDVFTTDLKVVDGVEFAEIDAALGVTANPHLDVALVIMVMDPRGSAVKVSMHSLRLAEGTGFPLS